MPTRRGPGRPRNPDRSQIRRRGSDPVTVLATDGSVNGPELPAVFDWPEQTLLWWEVWRHSPQAAMFTDTDWAFLIDTAVLHAEFWRGRRHLAAELRIRVAKFGATPEDRAHLRIAVDRDPAAVNPAAALPVPVAQSRRDRLQRAIGA